MISDDGGVSVEGWHGWPDTVGGAPCWWALGPAGRLGPFSSAYACEKALGRAVQEYNATLEETAKKARDDAAHWLAIELASRVDYSEMIASENGCELWQFIFGDKSERYVVVGPDGVEEIELEFYSDATAAFAEAAARYAAGPSGTSP